MSAGKLEETFGRIGGGIERTPMLEYTATGLPTKALKEALKALPGLLLGPAGEAIRMIFELIISGKESNRALDEKALTLGLYSDTLSNLLPIAHANVESLRNSQPRKFWS